MPNASEIFKPLLCRGCGKHGLTFDQAKEHIGFTPRSYCRGGPANSRDKTCDLCGDEFQTIKMHIYGKEAGQSYVTPWRGTQIYDHKVAHIRAGDRSEDFE